MSSELLKVKEYIEQTPIFNKHDLAHMFDVNERFVRRAIHEVSADKTHNIMVIPTKRIRGEYAHDSYLPEDITTKYFKEQWASVMNQLVKLGKMKRRLSEKQEERIQVFLDLVSDYFEADAKGE